MKLTKVICESLKNITVFMGGNKKPIHFHQDECNNILPKLYERSLWKGRGNI